ncbi:MAG: transglycosylase domain-containing protein [Deltaproteobacteria bacterium]|nr:transglycosylase domain-containing protein [Deltaproteobacteria bacterium]
MLPVSFDGEFKNLTVTDARLASAPIRGVNLRGRGALSFDPSARQVDLTRVKLGLGRAFMDVTGKIELPTEGKPVVDLALRSAELPIQDAIDAVPAAFAPKLQGARVAGEMDFGLDLFIDFARPASTKLEPTLEVHGFRVMTPPPEANVWKLKSPFEHRVYKKGEYVKTIHVGPKNPDFVSYDNVGRILVGAVLTCEDGRFFRHHGFSLKHVRDSIRTNIRKERFARGASTISMQTIKNLFLTSEKTASRKFQEMILTWWMEEEIPKERILEIYLNIIEWGPRLYGIGPAARHYFGKSPRACLRCKPRFSEASSPTRSTTTASTTAATSAAGARCWRSSCARCPSAERSPGRWSSGATPISRPFRKAARRRPAVARNRKKTKKTTTPRTTTRPNRPRRTSRRFRPPPPRPTTWTPWTSIPS